MRRRLFPLEESEDGGGDTKPASVSLPLPSLKTLVGIRGALLPVYLSLTDPIHLLLLAVLVRAGTTCSGSAVDGMDMRRLLQEGMLLLLLLLLDMLSHRPLLLFWMLMQLLDMLSLLRLPLLAVASMSSPPP